MVLLGNEANHVRFTHNYNKKTLSATRNSTTVEELLHADVLLLNK
jgi:hypothetical protein